MFSTRYLLAELIASLALCSYVVDARAVFCHYMVGGLIDGSNHAQQDIDDAQAMGFDAFALNINTPTAGYVPDAVEQLFNAAGTSGFKLFFSMDATGGWQFSDWSDLLKGYLGNDAYYKGPNGYPFLSTFDDGSPALTASDWASFKSDYANQLYFVPDFDNDPDYYNDIDAFFSTWGSIVDGVFSWETAWPPTAETIANVSTESDQKVQTGAAANNKTYMVPLSSLQYKHWPDNQQHYYRIGEVNLPQRMTEILALGTSSDPNTIAPDFAEVITWNDVGESHYIGNIWDESVAPWEYAYANSTTWSHAAWQPLITSFIGAFKDKSDASSMSPPSGSAAIGAMWYRTILKSASCASDPMGKPSGWQSAQDAVNWAVVLPSDASGYTVTVKSGGTVIDSGVPVSAGLNYKSTPGMVTGAQEIQLLDGSGNVVMTATSTIDVASDTDGVCNFNYQVAGLKA